MGVKQLFNLHGKTALITGSSQGIGRSVALALAEHGANVVINYRSNRALAEQVQVEIQAMGVQAWLWEYDLGSVQQARPSRQMIVYAASKAAQLNMVTNLAWLLGRKGITVNNLAPGVIGTVRNREVLANPDFKTNIEKHIPLGYVGEPNDLAATALLLCSDAGRYITGADIFVDGGMRLPE